MVPPVMICCYLIAPLPPGFFASAETILLISVIMRSLRLRWPPIRAVNIDNNVADNADIITTRFESYGYQFR